MLAKISLFFVACVFILSCSNSINYHIEIVDGVEIVKNKRGGVDPSQILDFKHIFTIESVVDSGDLSLFGNIQSLSVDSKENIYILDSKNGVVAKFDSQGRFIKRFSRAGQGPGELLNPIAMTIKEDTIFVGCKDNLKIVQFDLAGNYIGEIQMKRMPPQFMTSCSGKGFAGFIQEIEQKNGKVFVIYNLELLDNRFNFKSVIHKNKVQLSASLNFLDLLIPFTVGKEDFYVSSNSDDFYEIRKYNRDGKLVQKIKKQYMKITMNKDEIDNFDEMMSNMNSGNDRGSKIKMEAINKKSINGFNF